MNMYRSRSGSNQPEPVSIELPTSKEQPKDPVKLKGKKRKKEIDKNFCKNYFCCSLIALQWAQGAKDFSLVVLH